MLGVIQYDHSKCSIQYSDVLCSGNSVLHYFKFKMQFFFTFFFYFSKLNVRACLNSRYYFSLFENLKKHHFPVRTSGLGKSVVNFMASETYLLAKIVEFFYSLINAFKTYLRLSNYHPNFLL
jgi:hypothetical protein